MKKIKIKKKKMKNQIMKEIINLLKKRKIVEKMEPQKRPIKTKQKKRIIIKKIKIKKVRIKMGIKKKKKLNQEIKIKRRN